MNWTSLPSEILGYIFTFLSRRDKLAFVLTCGRWREATDTSTYWDRVTVKIDEDFYDSSLIFLTQQYYRYMHTLEIGWSVPFTSSCRWPSMRHKDTVKRVGRLLVLLFERNVQLRHLIMVDWYDIYHLRKLSYLLLRFLKQQNNLESITLRDANPYDMNFTNVLLACLRSKGAVRRIDLHYTTYHARKLFDSWIFTNCMELFYNLEVLTIDCWIFWQFFNKLQVRICKLKEINLYLDDSLRKLETIGPIREKQGEMFFAYLPRAVVRLTVEKTLRDGQCEKIVQKFYPLVGFTWNYAAYKDGCQTDCCQCLERLANVQCDTLEYVQLRLPLRPYQLSEKIEYMKKKCHSLRSFVLNDVELIHKKECFARLSSC